MRDKFTKKVLARALLIILCILLCKYTAGVFSIVMCGAGLMWSMKNNVGKALSCFVIFPMFIILSPIILPKPFIMGLMLRVGPLILTLGLVLSATKRRGNHSVPLAALFIYLISVSVSSIGGYAPSISFLKLINFALFLVGVLVGTRNMHTMPKEIEELRITFYAMTTIMVIGGIAMLPFPAICYPQNAQWVSSAAGGDIAVMNQIMRESTKHTLSLFAGITYHSQTLAPLISCMFGFVLCDMLFVEKKIKPLPTILLTLMPIMLFLTRSRTGLLSFLVACLMVVFFARSRIKIPFVLKKKINSFVSVGILVAFMAAIAGEVTNGAISRWIFKTEDVSAELSNKGVAESLTTTRSGLIDENLFDFKQNPLLGIGFQVNYESSQYAQSGFFVLSAPVEKGVLPLMILGEGGVVGAIAFLIFLVSFYSICFRKKYIITLSLFTVLLATNIGEASFFSPGGPGGILWMYCVVGGFMCDMLIKRLQSRNMIHFGLMTVNRYY